MKLKIWWIPQVPMHPFEHPVGSIQEARNMLNCLADYDKFQFDNHIKPDYCNVGGLMIFDNDFGDWVDWEDEDGEDIWKTETVNDMEVA